MRHAMVYCLLLSLFATATPPIADGGTVSWSFGAGDAATCPKSISVSDSKIVVDLSVLPNEARPFRDVLRCQRERVPGRGRESEAALVVAAGDEKPLPLLPQRFSSFDATTSVVQAVQRGARRVEFIVKSLYLGDDRLYFLPYMYWPNRHVYGLLLDVARKRDEFRESGDGAGR